VPSTREGRYAEGVTMPGDFSHDFSRGRSHETIPEGIIGIVAGKLCEKYNLPAIVCTKGENGCWKGSARSIDGVNIKERLDAVADTLLGYGGHAGAAGVQIAAEKKEAFVAAIRAACEDVANTSEEAVLEYDLEIDDSRVVETYRQLAGKQIGAPAGKKRNIPKAETAKEKILKHSKDFGGTLSDTELIAVLGISRNSFYKYKREVRN